MKTKLIIALILLVMLNACTLAGEKPNFSEQNNQPTLPEVTFVGVYFAPYENSIYTIEPFDINNNNLTFFISEQKTENGETYSYSHGSGNFMSGKTDVSVSDKSDITTFTSKIPVMKNVDFIHAVLAIYKDAEGNYITIHQTNLKGISGFSVNEDTKINIDGDEFTKTIAIDIEFVEYDPLKEVRVLIVDEKYNILEEQIVDGPSEFTLENALHYIVVEEIRLDNEGLEYKDVTFYSYRKLSETLETSHTIVSDTEDDYAYGKVYGITLRVSH